MLSHKGSMKLTRTYYRIAYRFRKTKETIIHQYNKRGAKG